MTTSKKKNTSSRTRRVKDPYEDIPVVRHTLSFPQDVWDALKREANARSISANALLRDLLSDRYRSIPKVNTA